MFIKKTERIIAAVSGGPDSMYLLNDLVEQGYENIFVCHVNYHWRNDSDNDQKIVEEFCKKHNLNFELKSIDKKVYENKIGNFEAWARDVRYKFFEQVAKQNNIKYCFVAHNMNDSIETFILQKKRKGLVSHYGLMPVSTFNNLTIVRPLLGKTKAEILDYDNENKIPYAIDSTNADTKYSRNKIRSELKESDFNKYLKEMNEANIENDKLQNEAKFYANNNLTADQLKLNDQFHKFSIEKIMWILIKYLESIRKDNLLVDRDKNTLREIAKELKTTKKVFIKIKINDDYFIKDYDVIYVVPKDWFNFYRIEVKSMKDLDKIKGLQEWVKVQQDMDNDNYQFPYLVTNDYEYYKKFTTVGNKKTNRYFIDKKISYKDRYQRPIVINLNTNRIVSF